MPKENAFRKENPGMAGFIIISVLCAGKAATLLQNLDRESQSHSSFL